MLTPWGEKLDKSRVLSEYPRPQLRRKSFLSLNGEWDFTVKREPEMPDSFDGRILVPFSPESVLSGAEHIPAQGDYIWYRLDTELPGNFNEGRVILHFDAVDQCCTVWVNGFEVTSHEGGFAPFCADITKALDGNVLSILVCARDLTEQSGLCRGNQSSAGRPGRYTAQSGIWQSVWLESVPENYIRGLRIIPHYDNQSVELWVAGEGECTAVIDGESYAFPAGKPAVLELKELHPWTPEYPYLYNLELQLGEDRVESYFAMRKFSAESDANGLTRLYLNNKPYFQKGVLDEGRWPDGLMTPPSDAAMISDIQTAKSMGFNMIRKHQKIEPLRWYYHCDRLGIIVWQDIPAGGAEPKAAAAMSKLGMRPDDGNYSLFGRTDEGGRDSFRAEMKQIVNALFNCPCIALWTLFEEGRGQFDTDELCIELRKLDPTRLIDHCGGSFDQGNGDVKSVDALSRKISLPEEEMGRALVLSRFGGYTFRIEGHCHSGASRGGKSYNSPNSFQFAVRDLYKNEIFPLIEDGLSAAVYVQLSDTENWLTGLITYDRRAAKIPVVLVKNMLRFAEKEK